MVLFSTGSIFEPVALGLVDIAVKAAILFALASVIALAMRCRPSAATRHFVWLTAIVASLALPLLALVLPAWTIPISVASPRPVPPSESSSVAFALAEFDSAIAQNNSPATNQSVSSDANLAVADQDRDEAPVESKPAAAIATTNFRWQSIVVVGWLMGACVALFPVLAGSLSLWRLRRHSRPVVDKRILAMLATVREQMPFKRDVTLLTTPRRAIPMTWGVHHATVLLPDSATSWSNGQLRAVLMHELAHIERRDCPTHLAAQLARAVYWYNPLAWLAVRELRREQEKACDDRVLQAGIEAPDYAEHLLAVATSRSQRNFGPAVAMAMARSSRIEGRLRSILDTTGRRTPMSRPHAAFAATIALIALVPLATATLTVEAQADEQTAARDEGKTKTDATKRSSSDRFAELSRALADQYVTPPNEEQVLRGAIKGMVESLNDPFSEFLPAERLADLERHLQGKLTGIGAQLELRDGQLTVVTPLEGSPAFKAGIKPGDAILEIDGQPTRNVEITAAVNRILGEQGTQVRLKLRRASGENADVTIERGPIILRSVKGFSRGVDQRWDYMLDSEHKIGYIAVTQFGPGTAGELKEAIASLQESALKGLVLDIRFSPGGLLQSAHEAAELFLGEATVVTIRGRDKSEQAMKSDGKKKLGDFPMIALVNEHTASAAEVLAAALKDNGRAIIAGARTFGKGSVQSIIKLGEGAGAVRLTTAFYRSPSGRNIDRRPGEKVWGVDPTDGYFVPMSDEANDRLNKLRLQRDIIGGESNATAAADKRSPDAIAKDHGDPQLAAALRSLVAKTTSGEFQKVGHSAEAAGEYAQRRMEMQLRRDALTKSLEQLDRQWESLEKASTENPK
jgi:carboxyl-terminal processing protease